MPHKAGPPGWCLSLEHRESHCSRGQLATCPTGPDGGYDQALRTAWEESFSPLPDGARLLGIGTGNGAVLGIAVVLAARLGRSWQWHGNDLVSIHPRRDVADGQGRFSGLVFQPRVASEQLPFACELAPSAGSTRRSAPSTAQGSRRSPACCGRGAGRSSLHTMPMR